jgi:hypothetical protein
MKLANAIQRSLQTWFPNAIVKSRSIEASTLFTIWNSGHTAELLPEGPAIWRLQSGKKVARFAVAPPRYDGLRFALLGVLGVQHWWRCG